MRGQVNSNREAELIIRVYGPSGTFLDITATIDTGFTGMLILPESAVLALGLEWLTSSGGVLADGTALELETYKAEMEWYGQYLLVEIMAVGTEPLIGMALLEDSELRIEIRVGGEVELNPLGTSGVSP